MCCLVNPVFLLLSVFSLDKGKSWSYHCRGWPAKKQFPWQDPVIPTHETPARSRLPDNWRSGIGGCFLLFGPFGPMGTPDGS